MLALYSFGYNRSSKIPNKALAEKGSDPFLFQEQMHMIGHQAVGMQGDGAITRVLGQPFEIKPAIIVAKEYGLAVNATLDDVLRDSWEIETRTTWHALMLP